MQLPRQSMKLLGKVISASILEFKPGDKIGMEVVNRFSIVTEELDNAIEKSTNTDISYYANSVVKPNDYVNDMEELDKIKISSLYKVFNARFRKLLEFTGAKDVGLEKIQSPEIVEFLEDICRKLKPDEMIHYSDDVKIFDSKTEDASSLTKLKVSEYKLLSDKPLTGLYYSTPWNDTNSWLRYQFLLSSSENFKCDINRFTAIRIPDSEKDILRLRSEKQLNVFEKEFGESYLDGLAIGIDWQKVKDYGYKGIEIIPFHYDYNINCDWYSAWDCSTGVIWDDELVKKCSRKLSS